MGGDKEKLSVATSYFLHCKKHFLIFSIFFSLTSKSKKSIWFRNNGMRFKFEDY